MKALVNNAGILGLAFIAAGLYVGILVEKYQKDTEECIDVGVESMKFKIGLKGRHIEIPEGWRRVEHGPIIDGDKVANIYSAVWEHIDDDDIGMDAQEYELVIRKKF